MKKRLALLLACAVAFTASPAQSVFAEENREEEQVLLQDADALSDGIDISAFDALKEETVSADLAGDGADEITGVKIKGVNVVKALSSGELEYMDLPASVLPDLTIYASFVVEPQNVSVGNDVAISWSTSNKNVIGFWISDGEEDYTYTDKAAGGHVYLKPIAPGNATITATSSNGKWTATWNVTVTDPIPGSAPAIKSLTTTEDGVEFKWNKTDGATAYVLESVVGTERHQLEDEFKGTKYTDGDVSYNAKNGDKVTYIVKAYKLYEESEIPKFATECLLGDRVSLKYYFKSSQKDTYWLEGSEPSSVKNSAKKVLTAKWAKNKKASGYEIQYSTKKNFKGVKTLNVKGAKTTSKKITGLKKGKTYYVRVRPYKTVKKVKYYGAWKEYDKGVKVKK